MRVSRDVGVETRRRPPTHVGLVLLAVALALVGRQSHGQGYQVTESAGQPVANSGPVRMVRFSSVHGAVTWRGASNLQWSQATVNLPLRQGGQVYVPGQSRAEIQFDDGSVIRLGGGALVTFQTLYSDADGEFTELKVNSGLASVRLRNKVSIYQLDTPYASIKAVGPSRFRVGVARIVEVAVRAGSVRLAGKQGQTTVSAGNFVEMHDAVSAFSIASMPPDDSWERWNAERDRKYYAGSPQSERCLPPNLYLASSDLDEYGEWRSVPRYGNVWCPHEPANWRPYRAGHWVWVDPFGWTWVASEPWGWAPYHYGTWIQGPYGWAWVPGPAAQYWSPAVVDVCSYDGSVAWVPLCPEEVVYPPLVSVGFRSGNWSLFFSIGGCAVYYPGFNHVCSPRPWNTVYVNTVIYGGGGSQRGRPFIASNYSTWGGGGWVPRNARFGAGSFVSSARFASAGRYGAVPTSQLAVFQRGRSFGAPAAGRPPMGGPAGVRPTLASMTPTRAFARIAVPAAIAGRSLTRAPVDPRIARVAPAFGSPVAGVGRGAATTSRLTQGTTNRLTAGRPAGRPGGMGATVSSVPASVRAARSSLGVGSAGRSGAMSASHAAVRAGHVASVATTGAATRRQSSRGVRASAGTRVSHAVTPRLSHRAVASSRAVSRARRSSSASASMARVAHRTPRAGGGGRRRASSTSGSFARSSGSTFGGGARRTAAANGGGFRGMGGSSFARPSGGGGRSSGSSFARPSGGGGHSGGGGGRSAGGGRRRP